MARVRTAPATRARRKKWLKAAKGYYGGKSKLYRTAREAVMRAWSYSYRDRKRKKGDFRRLWIIRINAAAREHGLSYSRFMDGLRKANVALDRKSLADIAVNDADAFATLADLARERCEA
ncbi:MAG: 50S ribosomal protein L20 [bacterium]